MKRKNVFLSVILVTAMCAVIMSSCKKDPTDFTLTAMVTGVIDLNGATPSNIVPIKPVIVATFNTDVEVATAIPANVSLVQDYDKAVIAVTVTASGSTITVTPTSNLANGAVYKLTLSAGLKSGNGLALTEATRNFTTLGTFFPQGVIAHWNFENNANDQVGAYSPSASGVIGITYAASRNAAAGMAATFNGTTSLIEIPNGDQLMNTADFTLSFWIKADSTKHGQFVMGLAGSYGFQFEIAGDYSWCKLAAQYGFANGNSGSEDLWFSADGNLGWQGWTFCKDIRTADGKPGLPLLIASKWANVVCRYNAATKVGTMYINGEKMKEQDFNNWPVGDAKTTVVGLKYAGNAANNVLAFGFIQDKTSPTITDGWADYNDTNNNHFKGQLDDIMIFHKALTTTEILLMYNSAK